MQSAFSGNVSIPYHEFAIRNCRIAWVVVAADASELLDVAVADRVHCVAHTREEQVGGPGSGALGIMDNLSDISTDEW